MENRKPEPEYREVELTIIDVRFVGGESHQLMLRPEDKLTRTDDEFIVELGNGEVVNLARQHILWTNTRTATVNEQVKPEEKAR